MSAFIICFLLVFTQSYLSFYLLQKFVVVVVVVELIPVTHHTFVFPYTE